MYKVGVTGGIGSGKSIVCRIFRNLDIPVYEADVEARRIMAEDPDIGNALLRNFGNKVFRNSVLDRKYLADRIFSDSKARQLVNKLVHPKVREDFRRWIKEQDAAYVIEEAALLFESGAWKEMDINIMVLAPEEIRIMRIMKRDGLERGDVLVRMDSQIEPGEAAKLADMIIHNNESEFVIPQVMEADRFIRERILNNNYL